MLERVGHVSFGAGEVRHGRSPIWSAHSIGQFHHVVETALASPDVENVHLTFVGTGNGCEVTDAFELPLVWAVIIESSPRNDFHRAVFAQDAAGQPHFTVGATADPLEKLVIGDN